MALVEYKTHFSRERDREDEKRQINVQNSTAINVSMFFEFRKKYIQLQYLFEYIKEPSLKYVQCILKKFHPFYNSTLNFSFQAQRHT